MLCAIAAVTVGLLQSALSVTEDEGEVSVCASILTGQIERDIVLQLTFTPDTASGGVDFTSADQSLTFTEEDGMDCADVKIFNDDFFEETELFIADLSCNEEIVDCGLSRSVISIRNDDRKHQLKL